MVVHQMMLWEVDKKCLSVSGTVLALGMVAVPAVFLFPGFVLQCVVFLRLAVFHQTVRPLVPSCLAVFPVAAVLPALAVRCFVPVLVVRMPPVFVGSIQGIP